MRLKFSAFFILLLVFGKLNYTLAYMVTRGRAHDDLTTINSISIHIQPHGSYLDITERAIISPTLPDEDSVGIIGSFSLPEKATIVYFTLSDSNNIFSSRILPVYKGDFPVDSTLGDPLVQISLLNTTGGTSNYNIKIASLTPKKHYGISIRYLMPNSGNAAANYNLNVLWDNPSQMPGIMEFSFKSEPNGPVYVLNLGNSNFQLTDGQSLQIPYKKNYRLISKDNVDTRQHITSIEEGDLKGQYLLLNTTVPDSVVSQLSKPIELLFLWRWNKPTSFVKKNIYQGTSWLTTYGQNAIDQASALNNMIKQVAITGNQTGMVHSIQYRKPEVFPLCKKNSASFNVLTSYLSQMDQDYFLNSGYYEENTNPTNPDDTLSDSSRTEFLKSLSIVKGLYSNGAGIMKHLIIVTCGPVRNSRDIITLEELDPLIKDISVSCDRAFWKDVSFANVEGGSFRREFVEMGGFKVPQFRPSSLILQLVNTGKSYSFPLSIDQNAFSIIAKSEGAWSPQLTWYGFDKSGAPFDTAQSTAAVYQSVKDTGLVKLWATNSERISEKVEYDVASQYGVISKYNDLRVYPSFKWNDTSMGYSVAYNYYSKSHHTLVNTSMRNPAGNSFSLKNRIIKIALPHNEEIKRLKIFSLGGSLIADLDPATFKAGSEYMIPLKAIFSSRTSGLYLFVVEGKNKSWTQRVWIRN